MLWCYRYFIAFHNCVKEWAPHIHLAIYQLVDTCSTLYLSIMKMLCWTWYVDFYEDVPFKLFYYIHRSSFCWIIWWINACYIEEQWCGTILYFINYVLNKHWLTSSQAGSIGKTTRQEVEEGQWEQEYSVKKEGLSQVLSFHGRSKMWPAPPKKLLSRLANIH